VRYAWPINLVLDIMRIVGISGSLREESNNSKLIKVAKRYAPEGANFVIADYLDKLPHFNPDLDINNFDSLVGWVDLIRRSDGLVISSPEYARGYPGALKNAFDWLVQTDAHIDKPFMMLNASARSTVARDSLIVVLKTMSGIYKEHTSITIPILGKSLSLNQLLETDDTVEKIRSSVTSFVSEIRREQGSGI
jgi:chromate reductase